MNWKSLLSASRIHKAKDGSLKLGLRQGLATTSSSTALTQALLSVQLGVVDSELSLQAHMHAAQKCQAADTMIFIAAAPQLCYHPHHTCAMR